MKLTIRLFVQRHNNRNYTILAPLFPGISAYGPTLEECKQEIAEALILQLEEVDPNQLHQFEFVENQSLERVKVTLYPTDNKSRRRRNPINLEVSLLLTPREDGQIHVVAPYFQTRPLSFFIPTLDELTTVAQIELTHYFYNDSLEEIDGHQAAKRESLDTIEIDFKRKRASDKKVEEQKDTFWALKASGVNLSAQASEGQLRRAYRRDIEVMELLSAISSERRPSILLVGASGSGKTAIVHEAVRRIRKKECSEVLYDRQVWSITGDSIIAGCSFIGQWQDKMNNMVHEIRKKRHILFIEDIASLAEIGRWSKGDENIADFLKPHIQSGDVIIIGETTTERLNSLERLSAGFANQFRRIEVSSTNTSDTISILTAVARELDRSEEVRIEPSAIEAVIELTNRFQPYRSQPGKSVVLLEQIATKAGKSEKSAHADAPRPQLTRREIVSGFCLQSGLPEFIVADNIALDLESIHQHFAERVIGQPDAVNAITDLISIVKAGLNDPEKPLGVFLFIGPTGVGKTQLAKALAKYLFSDEKRMFRIDMSEYSDPASVRRLIGMPGAGNDGEGELTRLVRSQPFCVLLLDEFEKANPQIFDVFLQVFGEGRLTDSSGQTVSFHNSIILMTSNLGASAREQRTIGLSSASNSANTGNTPSTTISAAQDPSYWQRKVEQFFRPEFINRFDRIVVFHPLGEGAMRMIARRELGEVLLREGFIRRNLLIEIDDNVIDRLLEQGFNPTYGARPLKRAVEQLIVLPLARYLASRNRTNIDLIRVSCIDGKIELSTTTFTEHERSSRIELDGGILSSSGRRIRLDDQGLVAAFADLRRRLQDWNERPAIQEMQNERATALAETNKPTFWDDGNKARNTLARFYFLDRLLNRLKQLTDRVEYLEELSALVQKQRDARYRAELATSYEQIENDFSFFEIELLCAHLHDNHSAFIVLKRIGSAARQEQAYAWLVQLASIYLQWAQRKGYEIEVALLKPPSLPKEVNPSITLDVWLKMNKWREAFQPTRLIGSNSAEWTKELESQNDIHAIGIFLQGTNVFGFLKGEIGTHRRNEILPSGERTQSLLAVDVHNFVGEPDSKFLDQLISIQDERVADANSQSKSKKGEQKSPKPSDSEPSVIRTYQFDGERLVRDMRTGVKISNVEPILEGKIDELILAYLRDEESKQAWEISD